MKNDISEFTTEQIARIDKVQNAVWELCMLMTENEDLPWNVEYVDCIAEYISELLPQYGFPVHYPYREMYFSPKKQRNIVKIHDWYGKENA